VTEHAYIRSVHKQLPPELYRWKINDNFEGGVADAFYSGTQRRLFVEYKYVKTLPKRPGTLIIPACSALQLLWLRNRYNEGNNVVVILGSPQGAVIFTHLSWEGGISQAQFSHYSLNKKQVADVINAHCNVEDSHVHETEICYHAGRSSERSEAA
jgi:hypothetical protein